jgi:hypothetical protein
MYQYSPKALLLSLAMSAFALLSVSVPSALAATVACSVTIDSGESIASAVSSTPAGGTLCLNSGSYSLSSSVTVNKAMRITGVNAANPPSITQTGAFTMFDPEANSIEIDHLSATGFEHSTTGHCGGSQFVFNGGGAPNDTNVHDNVLNTFSSGICLVNASNFTIQNNDITNIKYSGIGISNGNTGSITGNFVYDMDTNGTAGDNAYGIVVSGPTGSPSNNVIAQNNAVYNSPFWECMDNHGGTNIQWLNNYCLAPHTVGFNAPGNGQNPEVNGIVNGNTVDVGVANLALGNNASIVMTAGSGGTLTCSTSCQVENNTIRWGAGNGCNFVVSTPPVTESGNVCGLAPATMSAPNLSATSFTSNQPNGVVATITANVSPAFPSYLPAFPGTLTITGTNSGGFQICGGGFELCQSSAGTPAGTYSDFNIVATLHGLSNSPQQTKPTVTGTVRWTPKMRQ